MANKKAKFVQIAVAPTQPEHNEAVYALDEAGNVWWYNFTGEKWFRLSCDRADKQLGSGTAV